MGDFFHWLATQYTAGNLELHIICDGIDYDKKFNYNPITDVLLAESSNTPSMAFGSDSTTLTEHVRRGNITIQLKFK